MRINNITNRIPVAIITLSFIAALFSQALNSLNWGHNSWQITEWLINYRGGFVRRGLPGEIIHFASAQTGIHANHIAISLSILLFILLIIILIKKASGRIPAILILSPIILGSAANQGFVMRKDVLVILLFIVCMSILKSKLTHTTKILLINITACIAILSHESFFFFGAPYLIFINSLNHKNLIGNEINEIRSLILSSIHFLPTIIIFFLLVTIFHGDATTAKAINSSWISLWRYINPNEIGDENPCAAIDAIQWPVKQGLALSFSVFTSKSIFFWLLTIVTCIYLTLTIPDETPPNGPRHTHNRNKFAAILTMQIICISPLFVLGWDFGRWIFLWTVSSIVIYLYDFNQPFLLEAISKKAEPIVDSVFKPNKASIWILLFFGVPVCCWSSLGYIASTPIGSMIISFKLGHFAKTILLNLGLTLFKAM